MRHYGPEWMAIDNELQALLKQVFKTRNEMFIVPGPASALHDMAIGGALGELAGKMFRVGHLGLASTKEDLRDFLVAVEEFLRHKNIRVAEGATLAGMTEED